MASQPLNQGFLYKSHSKQGASVLLDHGRFGGKTKRVYFVTDGGQEINSQLYDYGFHETGQHKYIFGRPGQAMGSGTVRVEMDDGTVYEQKINGAMDFRNGQETPPQKVNDGYGGSGMYAPGQIGYGAYPADLTKYFPDPFLINWRNIMTAPYQFTDPMKFGEQFGQFNRDQYAKNFAQSEQMALDVLSTELKGMQGYVPAASALKRQETAADNVFNQAQRTAQLDAAMPGVRKALSDQTTRANLYAQGRLPDELEDRALELGIRSEAADRATAGGFGATSSVAGKQSALMSAKERLQIAQYGENLLGQNVQTRTNTEMAPTQYSNAGAEVRVMPARDAGSIRQSMTQDLNQWSMLPISTALSSTIQQNQFTTGLEQQTRQFNATNQLQTDQFNANTKNNFALQKFNYMVGYAGTMAGALQNNINTGVSLDQQKQATAMAEKLKQQGMKANEIKSILTGVFGGALAVDAIVDRLFPEDKGSSGTTSGGTGGGGSGADTGKPPPTTGVGDDAGNTANDNNEGSQPVGVGDDAGNTPNDNNEGSQPVDDVDTGSSDAGNSVNDNGEGSQPAPDEVETFGKSFTNDTGKTLDNTPITRVALGKSYGTMQAAGVYNSPQPQAQEAKANTNGKVVYTEPALAKNQDPSVGNQVTNSVVNTLEPVGLTAEEKATLNEIGSTASDIGFLNALNNAYQRGDTNGFIRLVGTKLTREGINKFMSGSSRDGAAGALGAYQLYQNWNHMSNAQKALALTSIGINGHSFFTENDTWNKAIPGTGEDGVPALTYRQGLQLAQLGYNVYDLAAHWSDLDYVNRALRGTSTTVQAIKTYDQFKQWLDGATAANNAAVGGSAGVGGGGMGEGVGAGGISPAAGGMLAIQGTYQATQSWGTGGVEGRRDGLTAATTTAVGIGSAGGWTTPAAIAAGVAFVAIAAGSMTKTGKSTDQTYRDSVRKLLTGTDIGNGEKENIKLPGFGKEHDLKDRDGNVVAPGGVLTYKHNRYTMTLADGTEADFGIDGHGQGYNKGLKNDKGKDLQAFDTDLKNPLALMSTMTGQTLTRILAGGSHDKSRAGTAIDQVGAQVGNALMSNAGDKSFNEKNFNTVKENALAQYAKIGIKDKSGAYAYANMLKDKGAISGLQQLQMHQTINMLFDKDGFKQAQTLFNRRTVDTGVQVAQERAADAAKQQLKKVRSSDFNPSVVRSVRAQTQSEAPKPTRFRNYGASLLTKDQIRERNRNRYQQAEA